MKTRLLAGLLLVWLAVTFTHAATVTGTLLDSTGTAVQTRITFDSISAPISDPPNTIIRTRVVITNAANGTFSVVLQRGNYEVRIGSSSVANLENRFSIYVDGGSGTYDITDLVGTVGDLYNHRLTLQEVDGNPILHNITNLIVSNGTLTSNGVQSATLTIGGGTITSVVAGSGLTGGGLSGDVTLNVGAGSGITVNANDIAITTGGVTSAHILDGTIVNADISASAAIAASKVQYLTGVTSDVQTQLDARLDGALTATRVPFASDANTLTDAAGFTFAGDTLTAPAVAANNLTASRALVSDANKFVTNSPVTATELGYLSGVTSAVQTQIDGKLANVVEDTTPQLGGNLDAQGYAITGVGLLSAQSVFLTAGEHSERKAVVVRQTATGVTNIFRPSLTNLLATVTLQNEDVIELSGEHDLAPHAYVNDTSVLSLSSQAAYFRNLTNFTIRGNPVATVNITGPGNGLTFENTWQSRVEGIKFTQDATGLDGSYPIFAIIGQRQTNAFLTVERVWFDDPVDQAISHLFANLNRPSYGLTVRDIWANDVGSLVFPSLGQQDGSLVSGSPRRGTTIENVQVWGENYGILLEFDGSGVGHTNDFDIGETIISKVYAKGLYSSGMTIFDTYSNVTFGVTVRDSFFYGSTNNFLPNRALVAIKGGSHVTLDNLYVQDQTRPSGDGNALVAVVKDSIFDAPTISTNISLINSTLIGGAYGLVVQEGVQGIRVTGNLFDRQGGPAMQLWANGFNVTDNQFRGWGLSQTNMPAVFFFSNEVTPPLDNGYIDGNIFDDWSGTPLGEWYIRDWVSAGSTNIVFGHNTWGRYKNNVWNDADGISNTSIGGRARHWSLFDAMNGIRTKAGSVASPSIQSPSGTNGLYFAADNVLATSLNGTFNTLLRPTGIFTRHTNIIGFLQSNVSNVGPFLSLYDNNTLSVGSSGAQNLRVNTVTATQFVGGGAGIKGIAVVFPLTIDDVADGMDYTVSFVPAAFTITQVRIVHSGTGLSTPDVDVQVRHSTDRSAAGNLVDNTAFTVTSSTSGNSFTSGFEDATVPANSWIWIETSSRSGTTDDLNVIVVGTYD